MLEFQVVSTPIETAGRVKPKTDVISYYGIIPRDRVFTPRAWVGNWSFRSAVTTRSRWSLIFLTRIHDLRG